MVWVANKRIAGRLSFHPKYARLLGDFAIFEVL
jgi:hypothetical protein